MLGTVWRAIGMFAVTNVDDIVLLAVFFAQAQARRGAQARIVAGQYLGFAGILVVAVAGALGAGLLPEGFRPYLGLLPLALGLPLYALAASLVNAVLLTIRIRAENRALGG